MEKTIVFAGGCFWGVQAYFQRLKGVSDTSVGYAQGHEKNPSYEEVKSQKTGACEAVRIVYDPSAITLGTLIDHLFRFIDPTVNDHQAHDYGSQYRTGIYYVDPEDKKVIAAKLKALAKKYDKPILTDNQPLKTFYEAEGYHHHYLDKNPTGYCHVNLNLLKPDERK